MTVFIFCVLSYDKKVKSGEFFLSKKVDQLEEEYDIYAGQYAFIQIV